MLADIVGRYFFPRATIFLKMTLINVLVGSLVFGIIFWRQAIFFEDYFAAHLSGELGDQGKLHRQGFDQRVQALINATMIYAAHVNLYRYLSEHPFPEGEPSEIVVRRRVPKWMPPASLLRATAQPTFLLLLDSEGHIREFYNNSDIAAVVTDFPSLLPISSMERYIGGRMVMFGTVASLVVVQEVRDAQKRLLASLLAITFLDDDFMKMALPVSDRDFIAVMWDNTTLKVIASTDPSSTPRGMDISVLKDKYHLVEKSFFDDGTSELLVSYASGVAKDAQDTLQHGLVWQFSQFSLVLIVAFVLVSLLVAFAITGGIRFLTEHVHRFSYFSSSDRAYQIDEACVYGWQELDVSEKQ